MENFESVILTTLIVNRCTFIVKSFESVVLTTLVVNRCIFIVKSFKLVILTAVVGSFLKQKNYSNLQECVRTYVYKISVKDFESVILTTIVVNRQFYAVHRDNSMIIALFYRLILPP